MEDQEFELMDFAERDLHERVLFSRESGCFVERVGFYKSNGPCSVD